MRLMLFAAATLAAGAISAPAYAALVMTASVVDSSIKPFLLMESVGPFTQGTASAGIITPHFSSLNGVLTGASLSITATVRNDVFLQAHPNGFLGVGPGSGETLAGMSITGAGFEPIQSAGVFAPYDLDLRKSLSCIGYLSCSAFAQSFKTYSASRTIDDSALGAYVQPGGQQINATLYGAATCAALDGCKISNDVLFTTLSSKAQFEYLLHAAPSFIGTGQALDGGFNFGDVVQGSNASRGFNIFNFATDLANTTGLDLDSVVGTGDTSAFTTDLTSLQNLAPGASAGFNAFLDTSTLGEFSALYRINLSDADVGAGQRNSALFLRLSGRVVAADVVEPPVTGVPEPGTWALIMAGMGLTGGALRRRRAAGA